MAYVRSLPWIFFGCHFLPYDRREGKTNYTNNCRLIQRIRLCHLAGCGTARQQCNRLRQAPQPLT